MRKGRYAIVAKKEVEIFSLGSFRVTCTTSPATIHCSELYTDNYMDKNHGDPGEGLQ